jgi:HK97 family phage portal protein
MTDVLITDRDVRAGRVPLSDAPPELIEPAEKSISGRAAEAAGIEMGQSDHDAIPFSKWGAALAAIINPSVFACQNKIVEDVAGAEWRIVNRSTGQTVGDSTHRYGRDRLTHLLHDMTDREGGTSPFELMATHELTTGEVYWQMVYNRTGQLVSIDWLNSLNTNPDTSRGYIHQYTYSGVDRWLSIPAEQMLYLRTRGNLLSDFHGFGPVMAVIGSNTAQVMRAAGRAAMSHFINDGLPRAILSPDPDVQDQWGDGELKQISRALAPGTSALGKSRTLAFPYKAQVFESPDVQKWAELLRSLEPDIYRAFGVPAQMVGDTSTPYQNSDENRLNYDKKLVARLHRYAAFVNAGLVRRLYGRSAPVYFEFEVGPYQHIDPQERVAVKDLFQIGLADGNEVRQVYGFRPASYASVRFDPVLQQWVRTLPDGSIAKSPDEQIDLPGQPLFAPLADPETEADAPENQPEDEADERNMAKSAEGAVVELGNYLRRLNRGKAGERPFRWSAVDRETALLIESDLNDDDAGTVKSAVREWRAVLLARDGVTDYAGKAFDALPAETQTYIRTLERTGVTEDRIKAAGAAHYGRVVSGVARTEARYRFETSALSLLMAGLRRDLDQSQFEYSMTALVDRALPQNIIAGYADSGVKGHEINAEDEAWMSGQRETHHRYIWNLSGALYSDNPPGEKEVVGKPARWYRMSIQPAYAHGLVKGSEGALGVFTRGMQSVEPCEDCVALGVIVKPMAEFYKHFEGVMPPCDGERTAGRHRTACGSHQCGCEVVPVWDAEITPGPLPPLHGPHFERSASATDLPDVSQVEQSAPVDEGETEDEA